MADQSGKRPKFELDESAAEDETKSFNTGVGEGIRRARQEHGWTQAFLAEQAGLSPNYIARLERGELGPSLFVANRICDALGVSVEALLMPSAGGASSGVGPKKTTTKRRAG